MFLNVLDAETEFTPVARDFILVIDFLDNSIDSTHLGIFLFLVATGAVKIEIIRANAAGLAGESTALLAFQGQVQKFLALLTNEVFVELF